MVARLCHDVVHICSFTRLLPREAHSGPNTALAEGSASAPRACQSAQTCPPDRRNHLAPFRNLHLLLRRHSAIGTRATTADRWCSTVGMSALRLAFLPMHLASSSATGRFTGPCRSGCRRCPCSTCLTCFRLFWRQAVTDNVKRFAKNGWDAPMEEWKKCKTWEAKREFTLKLATDKTASLIRVTHTESLKPKAQSPTLLGGSTFGKLLTWTSSLVARQTRT